MAQNKSTAVMQRRSEPHDSLDDFPTPPWATRAMCEILKSMGVLIDGQSCREPCANRGYMVRPLQEFFSCVEASDIHDYGFGYGVEDYLFGLSKELVDWTFFNPPFKLAEQFIQRALVTSRVGVVAIVRSAFTEGMGRYDSLFSKIAPSYVFQCVERVPMVKGMVDRKAASATAYSWIVWLIEDGDKADTRFRWVPPCRKRLERDSDYNFDGGPQC